MTPMFCPFTAACMILLAAGTPLATGPDGHGAPLPLDRPGLTSPMEPTTGEAGTDPSADDGTAGLGMDGETDGMDCGLASAEALVGTTWSEDNRTVLQAPERVRVLRPGDAATMDFSPTRLNILLDDSGVVQDVTCG